MRTGDLPTLQKILGHASPQMTLRYAHLAQEHLAAEMKIFDSSMPVESHDFAADGHYMDTSSKTAGVQMLKKPYKSRALGV